MMGYTLFGACKIKEKYAFYMRAVLVCMHRNMVI